MTEAELVKEIEAENGLGAAIPFGMNNVHAGALSAPDEPRKLTEREGEAIYQATQLITSALRMLGESNAPDLRSDIVARLSAAMTLVTTL